MTRLKDKTALITGATSGIGLATARALAQEGCRLIITGRRDQRLAEITQELERLVPVLTLNFDVRDRERVFDLLTQLPEEFKQIDILINNAGNAHGLDFIQDGDPDDWDAMIDINVKGLLYVSKAIIPDMVRRGQGHVIHIGSTAGKEVYPKGNVYCASKHAVDALNHGMRIDLNGKGIKVSAIHPGLVETEFSQVRFKGDTTRAEQVYKGFTPLTAQDIAEIIVFVLSRPAHVNIADLMVMCLDQASSTIVNKRNQ
jgi:3-hydroxy acid dehydrogenase/malonic semialdehyde reductase